MNQRTITDGTFKHNSKKNSTNRGFAYLLLTLSYNVRNSVELLVQNYEIFSLIGLTEIACFGSVLELRTS